jgi:hypothetical protein
MGGNGMSFGCGHIGCKNCGREAEYELVNTGGLRIPLCPQCALAVTVYGIDFYTEETDYEKTYGKYWRN